MNSLISAPEGGGRANLPPFRLPNPGAFTNRGNAISGRPASGPQKTPVWTLCFLYHLSAFSA